MSKRDQLEALLATIESVIDTDLVDDSDRRAGLTGTQHESLWAMELRIQRQIDKQYDKDARAWGELAGART